MRLRIAAAAGAGIILIGILAWPYVAPDEPFAPVSLVSHAIAPADAGALLATAFLTGLIAYFLSWPYGRQIGIIAVPAGLAVWALRSGDIGTLMQTNPVLAQRYTIFAHLMWEPFVWLVLVAAGFAGVLAAQKLKSPPQVSQEHNKAGSGPGAYVMYAVVFLGSAVVATFFIGILAQDVHLIDNRVGTVVGQPAIAQIAFAVLVAFGSVAFLAAKFLNVGYLCPIFATGLVNAIAVGLYVRPDVVNYIAGYYPPVFFTNSAVFVLPIQMVGFGAIGSIAGYWLAVRYDYWRQHESVEG
jgi:hypothetical protein